METSPLTNNQPQTYHGDLENNTTTEFGAQDGGQYVEPFTRTRYKSNSLREPRSVDRTDNGENRTKLEHHSRASSALVSDGIHEGGLKIGFFLQSMLVPIQQPGTNLWEELERTTNTMTQPWLVTRDFNDFTDLSERKSFSLNHSFTKSQRFRDRINKCNLIDLGSVGPRLTWTNNRQGLANTMERLDKAISNDQWQALFPEGTVKTLPRTYSDHSPLVVFTQEDQFLESPHLLQALQRPPYPILISTDRFGPNHHGHLAIFAPRRRHPLFQHPSHKPTYPKKLLYYRQPTTTMINPHPQHNRHRRRIRRRPPCKPNAHATDNDPTTDRLS
ncbi:hypothetical protein LOK49_LG02G01027 [Camellia lanceoleosa]|uniref:Uncharacterized protein n=1 Tax=Camellia lanceoleosa TaxID=1840588 RepID=A0ACC0IHE8_9ERIC|nr:hypothetical protein LOK49_LG02G01027 [Camellia lanceoleosa]